MGQESGSGLAGWLELRIFHEVTVKMAAGAAVCEEDLTGAGGPASKLTHLAVGWRPQFLIT